MLWIIYIGLIILGLFYNNSRVYDVAVIVFMGVIAYINTDSADYVGVYLRTYYDPLTVSGMDPGWVILCQLGNNLGLSYNGFACILTVLSMSVLRQLAKRMEANTSFMLALFLVYPGLMSIVQFRQFVASAVGALAIIMLCSELKSRYLLFSFFTIVAFSVHRSAAVIICLLLLPILRASGKRGRIAVGLVVLGLCVLGLSNVENIGTAVFGELRTDLYLSANNGANSAFGIAGIINSILVVALAVLPVLCYKELERTSDDEHSIGLRSIAVARGVEGVVFLNAALLLLIPFVFITNDFMRFERFGFTYAIVLFSMMPRMANRHLILSCKAFYVALCLVFAILYVANTFDAVYGALLSFEYFPSFFA